MAKELSTKPKRRFPEGHKTNPADLTAGRYGTLEMVEILGPERTMDYQLRVQGWAAVTLSELNSAVVPDIEAREIFQKASILQISPARIRELEEQIGHDVIAINKALEEVIGYSARPHVNKARTSADTTQSARALQLKAALKVAIDSVENLRDITIERALAWKDIPHVDTTHLIDALPTVAGRPFAHYAEMLQSGLNTAKFVYQHSILGKWADATGNHHGASALGIDGLVLETRYCQGLGIRHMTAPAQVPGLEFEADVIYTLVRIAETVGNLARYVRMHKGSDFGLFLDLNPRKRKGSASMPHKDLRGGNPTAEEQAESMRNYLRGSMITALTNCQMDYGRDLTASANARIVLEDGFKFFDHGVREMAKTVYWLGIDEERARERVERTYGITTSNRILQYITDPRQSEHPLPRSQAHDLLGKLATEAWNNKIQFSEILLRNEQITSRMPPAMIQMLADPFAYSAESKNIIEKIAELYYQKKTISS